MRGFSALASAGLGPLHHVTIITEDVRRSVRFYGDILGLRCVKRTVNYDDPTAHHIFFGDGLGRSGSLLTLFEWTGLPAGRPGIGTVQHVALRLPSAADLDARLARARAAGVPVLKEGERSVELADPDGCRIELIAPGEGEFAQDPRAEVRLDHVLAVARDLEWTAEWCERVLGLARSASGHLDGDRNAPLWQFGEEASLRYCAVRLGGKPVGHLGPGVAHHAAFRVGCEDELQDWADRLRAEDVPSTPIIDRLYFRCVYFRDPDGTILELATDAPGLSLDEPAEDLGGGLRLPPWLEPRRDELAAGLSGL